MILARVLNMWSMSINFRSGHWFYPELKYGFRADHTRRYSQPQIACTNLLKFSIEYFLLIFRVTDSYQIHNRMPLTKASLFSKESDVMAFSHHYVVLISNRPIILAQPTLIGFLFCCNFGVHLYTVAPINRTEEIHIVCTHIDDNVL